MGTHFTFALSLALSRSEDVVVIQLLIDGLTGSYFMFVLISESQYQLLDARL